MVAARDLVVFMNAVGLRPLQIFIVENHGETLKWLTAYLELRGHEVTSANSMAEALSKLATARCDVLISDIGLPDGDGWQLLERAKLPANVLCIAMSGYGMKSDALKSKEAGFAYHLLKPFEPVRLNGILEEFASRVESGRPSLQP